MTTTELTEQQRKAFKTFRDRLADARALAHFDRVAPELARRLASPPKLHPKDDRDPTAALVWDWFNAHYPGSPASEDALVWEGLVEAGVPNLITALEPAKAAS
jgi:hypothetical protein